MKNLIFFFLSLSLISCDPKMLNQALDILSESGTTFNVADGLKQALNFGVKESVNKLSKSNGFKNSVYKILLPDGTAKLIEQLRVIDQFAKFENQAISKINQAAEHAAKKATPIFVNAITSMTFDDATNILMGRDNAATSYLHNRTYNNLYSEFKPVIKNSLNQFGASDYYADGVNFYNKNIASLFGWKKENPDIVDHVNKKALEGLFALVQVKEKKIRTDVSERTTDLLKNVFAKQDN